MALCPLLYHLLHPWTTEVVAYHWRVRERATRRRPERHELPLAFDASSGEAARTVCVD